MSRTDTTRTRPARPILAIAGALIALVAGLLGPTPSAAQAAQPRRALPLDGASSSVPQLPAPISRGAAAPSACCAHPDPPRTPGVPYRWCMRHHKCWEAHQFVARQVRKFRDYRRDGVTHRILPDRFERKLRRLFAERNAAHIRGRTGAYDGSSSTPTGPADARRDNGGYDDWVEPADCVVHGYGCYFPTNPRPELNRAEKTFLWCGGTVVVAGLPVVNVTLGEAGHACFWGATYYWLGFWR
jgi:hypothetical protein